jgi:isopentenyl-diphosphate delta-isomerase
MGIVMSNRQIYQRKIDHIELCHKGAVQPENVSTLFEELTLIHQAIPELKLSQIDISTQLLGKSIKAPFMVTGMTGGPEQAKQINLAIAGLCEKYGIPFGLGSQRIITKEPDSLLSFQVRSVAPTIPVIGNLGVNQVRDLGISQTKALFESIEADFLAIHLNPAMELVQGDQDADRDFSTGYETIARINDALNGAVLVKECGCGLSAEVVEKLMRIGIKAVDLSGTGGTSWIKVEALRNQGMGAYLGHLFEAWGIPTAAAVLINQKYSIQKIASGGIDQPLTAAKAIALGADLSGFARPILKAYLDEGIEGADFFLDAMVQALKITMLLTGAQNISEFQRVPKILGPKLQAWQTNQ